MTREEVNGLDERIKELKLQHQEAERINLKNKAGDLLVDINYLEELRELRNKQEPILDKIRAEIKQKDFDFGDFYDHTETIREMVVEVIDKYRESEE